LECAYCRDCAPDATPIRHGVSQNVDCTVYLFCAAFSYFYSRLLLRAGGTTAMWLQQNESTASFRAEREFGLLAGLMAILIGSWRIHHGRPGAAAAGLLGAGSALAILALFLPRALVLPNRWWMALSKWLSLITTPIILGIIFFLVIMPIGRI